MTETRPRRRRLPGPFPVVLATIATFLVVLALLAVQLQAGRDPALGSGATVAQLSGGGHRVVTRTSGGGQVTGTPAHNGKTHPVTTRTSGGGEGEHEDD